MATWSTRRKYGFFFGFILVVAAVAAVPVFFTFYKAPTCDDGKKNGDERGIDCGGACARICPADFTAPKVLWSHSMMIVPGVYNALAYAQNPNQFVEVKSLPYVFRLYDEKGVLILERSGRTAVPSGQRFAVFEGAFETGERVPFRTTFEFTGDPQWIEASPVASLRAQNVDVEETATPRAEVRVKNEAAATVYSNIDAFIILYDATDNRVAFSKTTIAQLLPGAIDTIYFTWPRAFERPIVRTEVLFVVRPKN